MNTKSKGPKKTAKKQHNIFPSGETREPNSLAIPNGADSKPAQEWEVLTTVHSPSQLKRLGEIAARCSILRQPGIVAGPSGSGIRLTFDLIQENPDAFGIDGHVFIHRCTTGINLHTLLSDILNRLVQSPNRRPRPETRDGLIELIQRKMEFDRLGVMVLDQCHKLSLETLWDFLDLGLKTNGIQPPGIIYTGDRNDPIWLASLKAHGEIIRIETLDYLNDEDLAGALKIAGLEGPEIENIKRLVGRSLERLNTIVTTLRKLKTKGLGDYLKSLEPYTPPISFTHCGWQLGLPLGFGPT